MELADERIRTLIDKATIDELIKKTQISGTRWRTVRYDKRTRISTQELSALVMLYPQYALWLASGQIAPDCGQTSPDYDEAKEHLASPNQNVG
ncbi:hypothetical protein [Azotobacter beijerinckii]|uniref:hypothetical protein n=1 Tax=Azotobacter beijerinckii TaxID=170623 RepID=UPI000B8044B4|nr:hypothetical protein [Azotobacter beijerinckii]